MKKLLLLISSVALSTVSYSQVVLKNAGNQQVTNPSHTTPKVHKHKPNPVSDPDQILQGGSVVKNHSNGGDLPLSPNGKLLSVDGYEVDFIVPSNPEIHSVCFTPRPVVIGGPKNASCPFTVPCDDPSNRDVSSYTTVKYVQLVWHVMLNGGASTNINQTRIDQLMAELNADYATHNVIFCADPANFYEDAVNYNHDENTEEVSLKTTYVTNPTEMINIYVVGDMGPGGYARFPYDPMGGTSNTGGIVLNRGNCTVGTHTLAHEMGHTFGLEHTFAGVDERSECSSCYERVRNVNGSSNSAGVGTALGGPYLNEGDREGDWCSDTNPHDTYSYNCSTSPNSNGPCDIGPWANAPVNNHMSYSFCSSQFTAQQSRRMHCMLDSYLSSWTSYGGGICGAQPPTADFVGTPTTWQAPSNVNFTDLSTPQSIITGWTWTFDVGASGTVTCAGCVGASAQFTGQTPPAVTYPNPGLYTVSLTITSANGNDTETKINYIEVLAPAGDCDTLDTQWETPTPTPSVYGFGTGNLTGVPDPDNGVGAGDLKGMYEMFFTPNPGVTQVGAVRVGLGSLLDADDDMVFQVVVFDDDGFGGPGAVLGGVGGISPTGLGVPAGLSFNEFWIPLNNAVTPTTGTFHVGVEIIPGDATDELVVISSADGEGEGDQSNHLWTPSFGYENLEVVYGIDFDLDIVPMLGEYAPLPLITGFTENVVCDTTYVTLFDTALYSSVSSWSFTFADGTVINSLTDPETIDRVYTTPGPDTVTIAVINDCGRGDTTVWVIPYGFLETPSAEFSMTPNNPVCLGAPGVDFTADVAGYVDYNWDFGDGTAITSSGNVETINHVYATPGLYYVELTTTQAGYLPADTFYLQQFESGWPAGYQRFDNDPFTPNAGVNPPFTGTNATAWLPLDADGDGDGEAVSTSWNGGPGQAADDWMITTGIGVLPANQRLFWDGEALDLDFPDGYEVRISTVQLPANVGNYSTLLYSTTAENAFPTTHSVDLSTYAGQTVYIAFRNNSDDMFLLSIDNIRVGTATTGCSATQLYTDYVEVIDCSLNPPVTILNSDVTGGCAPLTVTFTDGTVAGDPADEWLWNFGDGSFSTLQNPPPHVYTNPGSYFVIFEACNNGGCNEDTLTIFVGDPAVISNVTVIDPTCAGNDGSITITATGGTGTLQYSVDNGVTFQASNIFNGLGAGTYDIVVEDAIGCQTTTTATLTGAAGPALSGIITNDPSCNGVTDGDITVNAVGGTAPLQYSIDNGVTFQGGNFFGGLGDGTYTVVVEDAGGCQVTAPTTLTDPPALVISSATFTNPNCGSSDGTITIMAAGGTGALQFSIDNGVTFQATNNFTGLAAGTYLIVVEDATGCQQTFSATLTSPGGPTITAVVANDEACGLSDGDITITASGGTGALQYSIDNGVTFQAGGSFAGLGAATYTIIVEDAAGCQATSSATINNIAGPTLGASTSNDPSCNSGNDGDITIVAAGGTGALQFSIDGGATFQASASFAGLSAGTYNIVVEDANGCQDAGTITLNDPAAVTYSAVITDENCGLGDGQIVLTGANGAGAPYQYSIDNGVTFQAGGTFAGLSASSYSIVVEDASGCQVTGSEIVNGIGGPVITVINEDISLLCNGDCNGQLTATVTGGTLPYQYSWVDGSSNAVGGNSATVNGLCADSYTLTVVDNGGAGCPALLNYTINQPTAVTYNEAFTDENCGLGDGTITISSASGGSGAGYQYSVDNGVTFQGTGNFAGLTANTYNVVVEDGNGCPATSVITIGTSAGPSIGSVTSVDPTCGGSNGSITISASGGTGALTYSINGGVTFFASANFGSLTAATFNIVVQDANGCQDATTSTLSDPGAPVITTITPTDPTCGGTNGSINIIASGGTGALQYSIDGGVTFQGSGSFSGIGGGSYTVVVEDAAGCQDNGNTSLTNTPAPSILSVATNDASCGNTNGSISVSAAGGTGALQYSIDNGVTFQASNFFNTLASGNYVVVVEDVNGCQATSTETIGDSPAPNVTGVTNTDPTCGSANGSILVSASGGTAPLQYSVDNGVTFQAATTFNGLSTGTYLIVVEDANGCQSNSSTTLTDPGAPNLGGVSTNNPSCGSTNGTITITASGGTGALQYSVNNGVSFQGSGSFTGLAPGTYDIVVEDAAGCSVNSTVVLADAGSPSLAGTSVSDPSCNTSNGMITMTASGGTPGYQYSINGGATFQFSANFFGLAPGTYNLVVEDANGCQATSTATLTQTGQPDIHIDLITDVLCFGDGDGGVNITVSGGTMPYQFDWSNDGTGDYDDPEDLTGASPGVVSIAVVDANGCSQLVTATIDGPGDLWATGIGNSEAFGGDGSIDLTVGGGTPPYSFSWSNGSTVQSPTGLAGNTTYSVTVTDANGCTFTLDVFVGSVVAISEMENPMGVVIAPNPNDGEFNVIFQYFEGNVAIDITDMAGKLVYKSDRMVQPNGSVGIDMRDIGAGVYFVNVTSEFDSYSTRVIKK